MPRGKKKSHKGGHRHFTSADDLAVQEEKARKEKEWRAMKGIESSEEEEEEETKPSRSKGAAAAAAPTAPVTGAPGELPPSGSDEEDDDEEDEQEKPKGVAHLIDIENPNHVVAKTKKVTALDADDAQVNLSRREREERDKQMAKERYQKLHLEGKTEEARADLARLALIRKQREDAAKKREADHKAQEDARVAAEKRLLEKKGKSAGDTK